MKSVGESHSFAKLSVVVATNVSFGGNNNSNSNSKGKHEAPSGAERSRCVHGRSKALFLGSERDGAA